MDDLVKKTLEVNGEFKKRGNEYDKKSRVLDMVEELGELSQAVQIVEGYKKTNDPAKARSIDDVADGLCDLLYEMVLLANDYELDLGKEYEEMLNRLKKRLESGEFD